MIFKIKRAAALIAVFVLTCMCVSQVSAAGPYWTSDRWAVRAFDNDTYCRALTFAERRSTGAAVLTWLAYSAKEKKAIIGFTSDQTTSLPDKGQVRLNIVFFQNGEPLTVREFEGVNFDFFKKSEGYVFVAGYAEGAERTLLEYFARSSDVLFTTSSEEGVSVARLQGSSEAVGRLRACAIEIAGLNPNDPFLR